ncbi:MAG TPA: nucleoside triphosphate pyrophosphohydrolase [Bacillota bacterium]|nr:nucleoside triphosphate pyrophosphohydrolase [Bacillota bacterium]
MKQKITIVGLGPGPEDEITLGAIRALENADKIILRTRHHGITGWLTERGKSFTSLDDLYDKADSFDDLYSQMVKEIVEAMEEGDVLLGLPGHPLLGERLTFELLKELDRSAYDIRVLAGISQAGALVALVGEAVGDRLSIMASSDLGGSLLAPDMVTVITGVYSPILASELKLKLLRVYPADHRVYLSHAGLKGVGVRELALEHLDHTNVFDHTACLYIPALELEELDSFNFNHLAKITERLRSPGGCPWDRDQDHNSLKQYLIEETYEVLEAIDLKDMDKLVEELGDLLFQVIFHSQIAQEHGEFNVMDVITGVSHKMIRRHPHIFGQARVKDVAESLDKWEAIKKDEKGLKTQTQVLEDIPSNLPALMRSYKVQKKAAIVGFDWDNVKDAMEKLEEELGELKEVCYSGPEERAYEELGDLLFAAVNVCRFLDIQPELCLTDATEKFIRRFSYIEENAKRPLEEMSLAEMDELWDRAKSHYISI